MSAAAAITVVRDRLRTTGGSAVFAWQTDFLIPATAAAINQTVAVELGPGQPPPGWGGQRFLGVWCSGYANGEQQPTQLALIERIGITCTLTWRWGMMTDDDVPTEFYVATAGMLAIARKVSLALHDSATLWSSLNTAITAGATDRFVEPLKWESTDSTPRIVGADWFGEDPGETGQTSFGLVMDIRFGSLVRMTCLQ